MPPATAGVSEGLAMSAGVLAVTAMLAWMQWREQKSQDDDLSVDDAHYFARRNQRRNLGTSILGLIGAGMFAGSLFDPRANRWAFLITWLAIGGLVCVLLVLAMFDWTANRAYARRHIRLLAAERRAILEVELKRRALGRNITDRGDMPHG